MADCMDTCYCCCSWSRHTLSDLLCIGFSPTMHLTTPHRSPLLQRKSESPKRPSSPALGSAQADLHSSSFAPQLLSQERSLSQSLQQIVIYFFVNYRWALAVGTRHLPPQGLSQVLPQLLTFNTPWKEFRAEMKHLVLWERPADQGFRYLRFYEPILWARFLYLFISRKALKSFMVTKD